MIECGDFLMHDVIRGVEKKEEFFEGISSPYISPEQGAKCVKENVSEFYKEEAYVWCYIDEDFIIQELECDFYGECPAWWDHDIIENESIDEHIKFRYMDFGTSERDMTFCLRQGLFIGQKFLVYISKPEWYRCSYEYDEWDLENEAYIAKILPPKYSVKEMEAKIATWFEDEKKWKERQEDINKAYWTSDKMYISWRHGGSLVNSSYCLASLCSSALTSHGPNVRIIANSRSNNNDKHEALQELAERVKEKRPDLTLEKLQELPSRIPC